MAELLHANQQFLAADPDERAEALAPILLAACEYGQAEVVALLIEAGARPTAARDGLWSPLCIAVACGHDDVVGCLLEHGAPISVHAAAALGDFEKLRGLVAADPTLVSAAGPLGAQPLHLASTVPLARWLVEHGADPTACDAVHDNSPARWAAADRRRQAVARYLVRFDPATELCQAAAAGDLDTLRAVASRAPALLNHRGSANDLLTSGGPLHLAIERGKLDAVKLLLELGADANLRSGYGHYPLHIAAMRGSQPATELLLAHGARRDVRDLAGDLTPRAWALRFGHTDLAPLL